MVRPTDIRTKSADHVKYRHTTIASKWEMYLQQSLSLPHITYTVLIHVVIFGVLLKRLFLFVCPLAHISKTTNSIYYKFLCMWPWLVCVCVCVSATAHTPVLYQKRLNVGSSGIKWNLSIIVQICGNHRQFSVCVAICYRPTLVAW